MKKILVFISLIVLGCTKSDVGCKVEKALVIGGTEAISKTLKCEGKTAIEADLTKLLSFANMCPAKNQKMIPFVCPMLVGLVKSQLGNVAPAAWKCDTSATQDKIGSILTEACEKIL